MLPPRPNYGLSHNMMTESIQRILAERALAGQTPANPAELIENDEPVASVPTDAAIHSAVPELVRANQSDADSSSWSNGEVPVK